MVTFLIALIGDKAAIVAHREIAVAVRDRVAKLIQEGKTQAYTVLKRTNTTR